MEPAQQPTREEFVAYWKDYGVFRWRQLLWYVGYVCGLVICVFTIRVLDPDAQFWLASLVIVAAYLVLVPYFTIRTIHTRHVRFIRCPNCRDWFGQDMSGAYFGPNPKFKAIIETGRCSKCGAQITSN